MLPNNISTFLIRRPDLDQNAPKLESNNPFEFCSFEFDHRAISQNSPSDFPRSVALSRYKIYKSLAFSPIRQQDARRSSFVGADTSPPLPSPSPTPISKILYVLSLDASSSSSTRIFFLCLLQVWSLTSYLSRIWVFLRWWQSDSTRIYSFWRCMVILFISLP